MAFVSFWYFSSSFSSFWIWSISLAWNFRFSISCFKVSHSVCEAASYTSRLAWWFDRLDNSFCNISKLIISFWEFCSHIQASAWSKSIVTSAASIRSLEEEEFCNSNVAAAFESWTKSSLCLWKWFPELETLEIKDELFDLEEFLKNKSYVNHLESQLNLVFQSDPLWPHLNYIEGENFLCQLNPPWSQCYDVKLILRNLFPVEVATREDFVSHKC